MSAIRTLPARVPAMSMFQVTPASSAARPALELTEAPLCAFIAAEQARWGGIARRAGMAAE